jgi:MFS family permease
VLVAMTGSLSMVMIDQTVVSVALPSMQRDLDLSQTGIQWVVNAYILALMIPGMVVLGVGLGFVMTPRTADALSRAPQALRSSASGVVGTMRQLGGCIGLAVIGTVIATLESDRIADIIASSSGTAADQARLSGVLSEAESGRTEALSRLPASDAGTISQVEDAVADSIAAGYRQEAEAAAPQPG